MTAILNFFRPKTQSKVLVSPSNSAQITIVHKKASQAETLKQETQEYLDLHNRVEEANAKIQVYQQEQVKAKEMQTQARAKMSLSINCIVEYLEGETQSLPKTQGGQNLLPLVQKALTDVKAIQKRHENGERVGPELQAMQSNIMQLAEQIEKLA